MKLAVSLTLGTVLFASIPSASAQRLETDPVPNGLSASDWSSIRGAYDANRHAAFAAEGGFQARNPGQQWRTRFDGRGFITAPDVGGWEWGLELVSYGREDEARAVSTPFCIDSSGQRVEYQWDDVLREWYVNDPRGLEHGYTVHQRPEGGAGALRFTLAVRGDLRPRVSGDGRGVTFVNESGAAIVNYTGLTVFDANGKKLPSWFDNPQSEIHNPQLLRIMVVDADAVYPLTIDPIAQQAYLKASNTESFDNFGYLVAVSGDTVVVGAYGEDSNATGINGNQADNSAGNSGAAYVFVRSGGVWSQEAYLKASNTGASDQFGWSVSVSGDAVVVGANQEASSATGVNGNQADNSAGNSGAAYVFVRSGGVWSQQAYLKASNTGAGDYFGRSVAVSGDTLVVGAYLEDGSATGVNGNQTDNSAGNSGAAYVFVRSGGVWSQQAYLKASNTGVTDQFGWSVSVSGDTVVVGTYLEDSSATGVDGNQADNSAGDSGAAYVFVRSGGIWSQQAYLKASNTGASDFFGWSVAVSGETVVVAAVAEDSNATGVDGNQGDNSATSSGAAYIFVRSGGVWSQQAYLKASNAGSGDFFGRSVDVSGDTVVVGADGEDSSAIGVNGNQADNSASSSGAAYVFVLSDGIWSQQAYLKASNTGVADNFGYSVAASGDTVILAAWHEDSSATGVNGNENDDSAGDSGAVYVFTGLGPDADGDGVPDAIDFCPTSPVCTAADYSGRPRSDLNLDCNVDGLDAQPLVNCVLNGGGACVGIDPDGDGQTADLDAPDDIAAFSTDAVAPATEPCP